MKVENKENNRKIQQVAATMAIEDMYMNCRIIPLKVNLILSI